MKVYDKINLTMLCDFYELTMAYGYFNKGYKDRITYFDVFYRRCPDEGGSGIAFRSRGYRISAGQKSVL